MFIDHNKDLTSNKTEYKLKLKRNEQIITISHLLMAHVSLNYTIEKQKRVEAEEKKKNNIGLDISIFIIPCFLLTSRFVYYIY